MKLRLLVPKGRIQKGVTDLLNKCGVEFQGGDRSYRPLCSREDIDAKYLKPQNIPELVSLGKHHCGFTGFDWIQEQSADVIELLDLEQDRARIVFAVPENTEFRKVQIVASEYPNLAEDFLRSSYPDAKVIRSWGATEALPPDDADAIVDVVSSGATLRMNRLTEHRCLLSTSTRFIANRNVYENCMELREKMDALAMLMKSCLDASSRKLLEMNVPRESLEEITGILPCMKAPTVAPLHSDEGFSVKAAVPSVSVPDLIPRLIRLGARDILEYPMGKIISGGES